MEPRRAEIRRATGETDIVAAVNVDGAGTAEVSTGVSFVDHMVVSLCKHSLIDMKVTARSSDGIRHHRVEDTAIAIGSAIDKALGDRSGIVRFGHASVPMDESLAEATVDLIRRPYFKLSLSIEGATVEGLSREDLIHFFQSLISNLSCCIHLEVRYGENDHHKAEAAIKALAVAIRTAASPDPRRGGVPSTKGAM